MALRPGGPAAIQSGAPWGFSAAAVLALIWSGFVWASGRGFDATDEATYLTAIQHPLRYVGASDFATLWAPLERLVGGDIRLLRIAGLVVLQGCGLAFGISVVRFAGLSRGLGWALALAGSAQVIWLYAYWKATPNYNTAALCGLMLLFVGLMSARSDRSGPIAAIMPGILAGLGLTLAALGKPTSGVAGAALCLGWIVLVRPLRGWRLLVVTAAAAIIGLAIAVPLLGESFSGYIAGKLAAWRYLTALGASDAPASRLTQAIVQPLGSGGAAKALSIAPFLIGLGALSIGWALPSLTGSRSRRILGVSLFCGVGLGLCAAWWRAADVWQSNRSPGYLAWCFVLAAPLVVAVLALLVRGAALTAESRRTFAAAILLALAPLAYAFGTNVVIVFHAAGAAIFWAAALIVLAGAPALERIRHSLVVLLLATSVGLVVGIAASPGPSGPSLWRQTQPTPIGPGRSVVELDPETAGYYRTFQAAALANGLATDTPIVDLGGQNAGTAFVLGGRPANLPTRAPQPAVRPWVLASRAAPRLSLRQVDLAGAKFPQDYMLVAEAQHRTQGWSEQLWKPVVRPGGA